MTRSRRVLASSRCGEPSAASFSVERFEHELDADQQLREAVVQIVTDTRALALAARDDLALELHAMRDVAHDHEDFVVAALYEASFEVAFSAVDLAHVFPKLDLARIERAQSVPFVLARELRLEQIVDVCAGESRRRPRQVMFRGSSL